MIELLSGIYETVTYDTCSGLKLYQNKEAENYPLHWHTVMEIILPLRNEYTVILNQTSHTFGTGDIFIAPPGILHALKAPAEGERLILLFDYSLICNIKGMDSLLHSLHPYALISKTDYPLLSETLCTCLTAIQQEYQQRPPFFEASLYALVIRFFLTLGRASFHSDRIFPGIASSKQQEYTEKFMMLCSYISEHCTEPIMIDQLADLAGFSRFHFSRLFKQFTGISCYQYLIQKRVAYAERLLIRPGITITEAAMESGFNSLATFNRVFKTLKGCTPSEYRSLNHTAGNSEAEYKKM